MVKERRLEKILRRYRDKNRQIPILVEGKKDEASLRSLEFPGEIIILNRGSSLLSLSESISRSHREIILLTDFDEKGVELERQIEAYLTSMGCFPDTFLWNYLRRYLPAHTVEDLPVAISQVLEED